MSTCVLALITVLFAFSAVQGVGDVGRCHGEFQRREQVIAEAKAAGEKDLVLDRIKGQTKTSAYHNLKDLDTEDPAQWPNLCMALYYGVDTILGR